MPRKLPTPHYAQPSCKPSSPPTATRPNKPETPAPGPKNVQEQPVGVTEASETEKVYPSPAPSPEMATCGSAPGREVGVGTDKDSAQNEPLSKKKALEWARIENLDHNKVNLEAKLNASKAAAKITAETVEKNKNDSKRQNIEEATPGSAPDAVCSGSRQVTPPAEATPGSAKAGISRTQFEKTIPRAKNNKTTTFCENQSRISIKIGEIPGLLFVLLPPRKEQVPTNSNTNLENTIQDSGFLVPRSTH